MRFHYARFTVNPLAAVGAMRKFQKHRRSIRRRRAKYDFRSVLFMAGREIDSFGLYLMKFKDLARNVTDAIFQSVSVHIFFRWFQSVEPFFSITKTSPLSINPLSLKLQNWALSHTDRYTHTISLLYILNLIELYIKNDLVWKNRLTNRIEGLNAI